MLPLRFTSGNYLNTEHTYDQLCSRSNSKREFSVTLLTSNHNTNDIRSIIVHRTVAKKTLLLRIIGRDESPFKAPIVATVVEISKFVLQEKRVSAPDRTEDGKLQCDGYKTRQDIDTSIPNSEQANQQQAVKTRTTNAALCVKLNYPITPFILGECLELAYRRLGKV